MRFTKNKLLKYIFWILCFIVFVSIPFVAIAKILRENSEMDDILAPEVIHRTEETEEIEYIENDLPTPATIVDQVSPTNLPTATSTPSSKIIIKHNEDDDD